MAKSKSRPVPEILIVFNPQAGSAHRAQLNRIIKEHFADRKLELLESLDDGDMRSLLQPWLARGVHLVIAAGGDGTVSEVAGALVNSNVPLGILPLGTGNVLVRELNIPVNANKAAKLLSGRFDIRRLDAIRVEERAYLLSVSVGISARTMLRTRMEAKRRFGRIAYIWTFLLSLIGLPQHEFEIEADGKNLKVTASEIIVLNAGILGYKALRWGPHVSPDDGQLDLCFIRAQSIFDYGRVLMRMFLGADQDRERMQCITIKERVVIQAPRDLQAQGDGDLIGRTPLEIKILPAALKVAVPVD